MREVVEEDGGWGEGIPAMVLSSFLSSIPKVLAQGHCARFAHRNQAILACLRFFLGLSRKGACLFAREQYVFCNCRGGQLSCSLFTRAAGGRLSRYVSPIFEMRGFFSCFFSFVFLFFSFILLNKKIESSLNSFVMREELREKGLRVKGVYFKLYLFFLSEEEKGFPLSFE